MDEDAVLKDVEYHVYSAGITSRVHAIDTQTGVRYTPKHGVSQYTQRQDLDAQIRKARESERTSSETPESPSDPN